MDGSTIIRNLEEQIFGVERLVFMADLYKERYGAKYRSCLHKKDYSTYK